MDAIDTAIKAGIHTSGIQSIDRQTWSDFYTATLDKRIALYGGGHMASLFLCRYNSSDKLIAIYDNDECKQGKKARDVLPVDLDANVYVKSPRSLYEDEIPDKTVVVVSCIKDYQRIYYEVIENGFNQVYILLMMEANGRISGDITAIPSPDDVFSFDSFCDNRIVKNKVFFIGYGNFAEHGKYIAMNLLNYKDIDVVFAVNNLMGDRPAGIRFVWTQNPKTFRYEMETSHIIVYNHDLPIGYIKRSGQIHIHTKHWASVTLKRFYLDSKLTTDSEEDIRRWKHIFKELDYIFVGSDFDEDSSKRGFGSEAKMIRVGSPRSDAMFEYEKYKEKIQKEYRLPKSIKLLLYAPTYRFKRDNGIDRHHADIGAIGLDYAAVVNALSKCLNGEWMILMRLHPAFSGMKSNMAYPQSVINVSNHEDGEELCAACDAMITDYSSIMFEPAFVKKPVFLFAPDRDTYIDQEYDLLLEYDSLPFSIAKTGEELLSNIINFNKKEYIRNVGEFMETYGVHEDGQASRRAADFIIKRLREDIAD